MTKPAERFPVPKTVRAHIQYDGAAEELPVRLIDFSTTGAGLEMTTMPRSGAPVIIAMINGTQRLELAAVIKWASPEGDGKWRAGCQFSQGIGSPRMFGTEPNRAACELPVSVSCQDGPLSGGEATIVDHSSGGIGILAEFAPRPASQLLVKGQGSALPFIVSVQWWSKDASGCFIGCQFARPADLMAFRELLPEQSRPEPVSPEPATVSNRGLWAGCALIYGWSSIYSAGGWPL